MKLTGLHRTRRTFSLGRYTTHIAFFVTINFIADIVAAAAPVSGDYMMFRLANDYHDKKAQYIVGRKYYTGTGVEKNIEEAVKYLNRSAQQGYEKAEFLLGKMNLYGDGVPTNFLSAYDLLNRAVEKDYTEAKFELANLLFHDKYGRKDTQRAISLYKQAAQDRHIGAQLMLGKIYYEGKSVSIDKTKAGKWLKLAADNGDKRAIDYLQKIKFNKRQQSRATLIAQRPSPKVNTTETNKPANAVALTAINSPNDVSHALRNAKSGDVDAQYIIGMEYLHGTNSDKNPLHSVQWLRKAAEQDHAGAQHQLGLLYRDGIGVAKSESEAIKWFRLAASWGISNAQKDLESLLHKQLIQNEKGFNNNRELSKPEHQYLLAMMYINGNSVEKDPSTAAQWLLKAAQQNHREAQFQLGQMYKMGLGVEENPSKAKTWLTKAADGGLEQASDSLKNIIAAEQKRLLDKDARVLANSPVYNYLRQADEGDLKARYNLGIMYIKGKQVGKDIKQGVRYLQLAAEDDHLLAQLKLAELYLNGLEVDKDFFSAAKWFKKAAEQGDAEAQYNLGNLYRKGMGVHRSNKKAVKWYRLAAKQGHLKARNRLGGCRIC